MPEDKKGEDPPEQSDLEKEFQQRCLDYAKAIEEDRHEDAESITMQMLQFAILRGMTEEPSQEMIWKRMAAECEECGNWAGAEEAYQKALALERENEVREFPVKTLLDLAGLYEMLGRHEEELAQIDAAIELSRKSDINVIRIMPLEAKARTLLTHGDPAQARVIVSGAVESIPDDKLHQLLKARLLVLLARCEAPAGDVDAAESALARALELTRGYSENNFLAGVQSFRAIAAEAAAVILSRRGQKKEAAARFGETVERARSLVEGCHGGPRMNFRMARVLQRYASFLESADDQSTAAKAREESIALLEGLGLPARP